MIRLPSPNGTRQAISPAFRSIATRYAYGGLISGIGPSWLRATRAAPGRLAS